MEYEVQFVGQSHEANRYIRAEKLERAGFAKHMKIVDEKVAARAGALSTPLTAANVEKHLENVGLDKEFGTHTRMAALSGGQKVKVVIAACMWNCPHIVILDEPTNYLDRDSLGALAGAIEDYDGGVVMITHNNEFCSALCPETWLMAKDETDGIARCNCKGDAEWMNKMSKKEVTERYDKNGDGELDYREKMTFLRELVESGEITEEQARRRMENMRRRAAESLNGEHSERQHDDHEHRDRHHDGHENGNRNHDGHEHRDRHCLLYTSDAADE